MTPGPGYHEQPARRPVLLLDACAVINLSACGHLRDILAALGAPAEIVDHVRRGSLSVRRGGVRDDADEREPIDVTDMLTLGLLAIASEASEAELQTFIDLTLELGDGEAMTAAIALHRGATVVTDDRVVLRLIAGRVPTLTSLELIKNWSDHEHPSSATLTTALRDLRRRGSYLPSRRHPLRPWWDHYLAADRGDD